MASLGERFDARTVDPSTAFTVYPADKYLAQIVQSEMRPTKNGDGQFLFLELEILDGEFSGQKFFDRLNLVNPNAQAQEISRRTLSAICHATGVLDVDDSESLHFKPMVVELKVKPAGNDKQGVHRDAQNEVKGYTAVPGGQGVAPQGRQAPASNPAPVSRPTTPAAHTAAPAAGVAARQAAPWRK